jgi:hypothetical protein
VVHEINVISKNEKSILAVAWGGFLSRIYGFIWQMDSFE